MNHNNNALQKSRNAHLRNAFRGDAQNIQEWNMAQIDEKERLHRQLQHLEEQKKSLYEHIHSQDAQDEQAMYELDEVVKEMNALRQHMKEHGFLEGGRRKRNRRTKRQTSRRSKRRAQKSRKH